MPQVAIVNVVGEIFSERRYERLIILCRVKFFCPEKPCFAVLPSSLEQVNVEKLFELGWDILQESENSVVRVLVSESIENKTLFSYESISVSGNPTS
jgi:hypothetical protein